MNHDAYRLHSASFIRKSEDTGKHPYYLYDERGQSCACPDFLAWKHAEPGSQVLYITLQNGTVYAMPVRGEEDTDA